MRVTAPAGRYGGESALAASDPKRGERPGDAPATGLAVRWTGAKFEIRGTKPGSEREWLEAGGRACLVNAPRSC